MWLYIVTCWCRTFSHRAQELCESRGGLPGLPFLNSPYGFCGRKATFTEEVTVSQQSSGYVWKSRWPSWAPLPYGLCGRKATFAEAVTVFPTELRICVKVGVAVRGFQSLTVLVVSVDVKQTLNLSLQSLSHFPVCNKFVSMWKWRRVRATDFPPAV